MEYGACGAWLSPVDFIEKIIIYEITQLLRKAQRSHFIVCPGKGRESDSDGYIPNETDAHYAECFWRELFSRKRSQSTKSIDGVVLAGRPPPLAGPLVEW